MKLKHTLESIKPLKETTDEVKTLIIHEQSVVTGSYAFCVETEESDIDIIIAPNSKRKWGEVVFMHNGIYLHADEEKDILHYSQDDFKSCYVLNNSKIYNLLFMDNYEAYNKWVYATNKMKQMCASSLQFRDNIKNKKIRVALFEDFKNEYIYVGYAEEQK